MILPIWACNSNAEVFLLMASILHMQKTSWCHWPIGVELCGVIDTVESKMTYVIFRVSEAACFGPAPGIFYPEPAPAPGKRES